MEHGREGFWRLDKNEMTSAVKFVNKEALLAPSRLSPDEVAKVFRARLIASQKAVAV
jgi:hypothetical protein